jgi:hypothetical protein
MNKLVTIKIIPSVRCEECNDELALGGTRLCWWCSDHQWNEPNRSRRRWIEMGDGRYQARKSNIDKDYN